MGAQKAMEIGAIHNQAKYEASVAKQNAKIAEQQSLSAGEKGAYEQAQTRTQAEKIMAAQKAAYGASGIDISGGTPLSVLAGTAKAAEQDVAAQRYNTALQMWGLQSEAEMYKTQAKNIKSAARAKMISSLISGATQAKSAFGGGSSTKGVNPGTTGKSDY